MRELGVQHPLVIVLWAKRHICAEHDEAGQQAHICCAFAAAGHAAVPMQCLNVFGNKRGAFD